MRNLYCVVLFSTIAISFISCIRKEIEFLEEGQIKVISYYKFKADSPYLIEKMDADGNIFFQQNYHSKGYIVSSFELTSEGDSIYYSYSNEGHQCYSEQHYANGDVKLLPFVNGKMNGVMKFYRSDSLELNVLFINDSAIFKEQFIKIHDGQTIVINDSSDNFVNPEIKRSFINHSYDRVVVRSQNIPDEGFVTKGMFFLEEKSNSPARKSGGDYFYLDVPDTVYRGDRIEIMLYSESPTKEELFLDFSPYLEDVTPEKEVNYSVFHAKPDSLVLHLTLSPDQIGHQFLVGYGILKRKDSSIVTKRIVFDDFFVKD